MPAPFYALVALSIRSILLSRTTDVPMKLKWSHLYPMLTSVLAAFYVLSVGPVFGAYILSRKMPWIEDRKGGLGKGERDAEPLSRAWDEYSGDGRSELTLEEISWRQTVYKFYTPLWWACEKSPHIEHALESYILIFGRRSRSP